MTRRARQQGARLHWGSCSTPAAMWSPYGQCLGDAAEPAAEAPSLAATRSSSRLSRVAGGGGAGCTRLYRPRRLCLSRAEDRDRGPVASAPPRSELGFNRWHSDWPARCSDMDRLNRLQTLGWIIIQVNSTTSKIVRMDASSRRGRPARLETTGALSRGRRPPGARGCDRRSPWTHTSAAAHIRVTPGTRAPTSFREWRSRR